MAVIDPTEMTKIYSEKRTASVLSSLISSLGGLGRLVWQMCIVEDLGGVVLVSEISKFADRRTIE